MRSWNCTCLGGCRYIYLSLSGAVEHLHLHGIAHRDVKAENVMLLHASRSQGLHCKLIDFGLAVRCLGFDGGKFQWVRFRLFYVVCVWAISSCKLHNEFCGLRRGKFQWVKFRMISVCLWQVSMGNFRMISVDSVVCLWQVSLGNISMISVACLLKVSMINFKMIFVVCLW